MEEYKFKIEKEKGMYEIRDGKEGQNLLTTPIVVPFGALIVLYRSLSEFCYDECIGGVSMYGNQRELPHVYAALRDKEINKEANTRIFVYSKVSYSGCSYEMMELICDGDTIKRIFPRQSLLELLYSIKSVLCSSDKNLSDPRVKVWADYVLNKMTEDVTLNYELFLKWLSYVHPETPGCYYEVSMDAYENMDDRLTLRQNLDIASAYIADHQHDYD